MEGLRLGITGELGMSKRNWELYIGEGVVRSFGVGVSSVENKYKEKLLKKKFHSFLSQQLKVVF